MIRILFVCTGNICRSPTAHGVFARIVTDAGLDEHIDTDSAGTHGYHAGHAPDRRAQAAAAARGIDISHFRGRLVSLADFESFDYILAMDESNFTALRNLAPAPYTHRVRRFMEFAGRRREREVPDPYYGGDNGFNHVLTLVEDAAHGLLRHLRAQHGF